MRKSSPIKSHHTLISRQVRSLLLRKLRLVTILQELGLRVMLGQDRLREEVTNKWRPRQIIQPLLSQIQSMSAKD